VRLHIFLFLSPRVSRRNYEKLLSAHVSLSGSEETLKFSSHVSRIAIESQRLARARRKFFISFGLIYYLKSREFFFSRYFYRFSRLLSLIQLALANHRHIDCVEARRAKTFSDFIRIVIVDELKCHPLTETTNLSPEGGRQIAF
jgi:hypothetical protein